MQHRHVYHLLLGLQTARHLLYLAHHLLFLRLSPRPHSYSFGGVGLRLDALDFGQTLPQLVLDAKKDVVVLLLVLGVVLQEGQELIRAVGLG